MNRTDLIKAIAEKDDKEKRLYSDGRTADVLT